MSSINCTNTVRKIILLMETVSYFFTLLFIQYPWTEMRLLLLPLKGNSSQKPSQYQALPSQQWQDMHCPQNPCTSTATEDVTLCCSVFFISIHCNKKQHDALTTAQRNETLFLGYGHFLWSPHHCTCTPLLFFSTPIVHIKAFHLKHQDGTWYPWKWIEH